MSHPHTDGLQNGLPSEWGDVNPSKVSHFAPINNGIESTRLSRTSSPITKSNQIPPSQIPPDRIPSSQLPPSRSEHPVKNILNLNTDKITPFNDTPISSPRVQSFGTSTPMENEDSRKRDEPAVSAVSAFSPVATKSSQSSAQIQQNLSSQFSNALFNSSKTFEGPTLQPISSNQKQISDDKNFKTIPLTSQAGLFSDSQPPKSAVSFPHTQNMPTALTGSLYKPQPPPATQNQNINENDFQTIPLTNQTGLFSNSSQNINNTLTKSENIEQAKAESNTVGYSSGTLPPSTNSSGLFQNPPNSSTNQPMGRPPLSREQALSETTHMQMFHQHLPNASGFFHQNLQSSINQPPDSARRPPISAEQQSLNSSQYPPTGQPHSLLSSVKSSPSLVSLDPTGQPSGFSGSVKSSPSLASLGSGGHPSGLSVSARSSPGLTATNAAGYLSKPPLNLQSSGVPNATGYPGGPFGQGPNVGYSPRPSGPPLPGQLAQTPRGMGQQPYQTGPPAPPSSKYGPSVPPSTQPAGPVSFPPSGYAQPPLPGQYTQMGTPQRVQPPPTSVQNQPLTSQSFKPAGPPPSNQFAQQNTPQQPTTTQQLLQQPGQPFTPQQAQFPPPPIQSGSSSPQSYSKPPQHSNAGTPVGRYPQYPKHQQQQQQSYPPNVNLQQPATSPPGYYQTQKPAYNQQPSPANYQQNFQQNYQQMNQQMANAYVTKTGFNKMWGMENFDLLQNPNILPPDKLEVPRVSLGQEFLDSANCSSDIFRCTITKIPESSSLLQKSRLPLGVLIHPFKDLNQLPVIQCNTIVRCRACRTYINPYIFFIDSKRWKCNLCYRVNDLPEEFQYDPVTKSYGDPSRRPEIKSSTIEYIAPSEYMLRPPQPAVYLFLLDISRLAVESGYLRIVCDTLLNHLTSLPGDSRTQIGFIAYDSALHFYGLGDGLNQPHEMIISDIDDIFLPSPDNLLVNLKERKELVSDLLRQLDTRYANSYDTGSALGAALQAAFKMMSVTGGRVTVFQSCLPTLGPGALTVREDPSQRAGKEAPHLNPATDFYKKLALDCSGQQIAVDLFIVNLQYVDLATLSGISRFSGGCMYHFPLFKASNILQTESLQKCFQRYLTRKIGFEAVMRIRCTRGLSIHTFHGNFFVRSTDLLSLPNINPDAGFGMQVSIDENLSDLQTVCFQAAVLYTSSKGERRIRVHTLCLPIVNNLTDILNSADQQCIVGLLAKMAVDRSLQASLSDARDAFINVAIDILSSYRLSSNMGNSTGLMAPQSLKLLPLYILALLKHIAFRSGQSTRLDDRIFAMCEMKTLPLPYLIQQVYPDLYPIHSLNEEESVTDPDGLAVPQPPRLQLTARSLDNYGAYVLDAGQKMIMFICQNVSPTFLTQALGVSEYNAISDPCYSIQTLDTPENKLLHTFINSLNEEKPYNATLQVIRDNSPHRTLFFDHLIEDRIESQLSYNEFLQHIKTQVK